MNAGSTAPSRPPVVGEADGRAPAGGAGRERWRAPVRWGIVGCGAVTEQKSGPAFQKVPDSALVAVMRRTGDLARDYAARHGVPRWYDDVDALLADPDVDAVYVATPPSSHLELALRVARAHKPLYVEKPMAMTHEECMTMAAAFEARRLPLFVAYYRRAQPRFLRLKALVDGGALGAVRAVRVCLTRSVTEDERDPARWPWRVRPEIAGGGRFVDLASHTLDALDFLLGPIAEAGGIAVNQAGHYPAEDAVVGAFRFASGAVGTGTWSFATAGRADSVEILGDRGHVTFATFDDGPMTLVTAAGTELLYVPPPEHVQEPLIRTLVDELLGRGRCPSTGASAARTSWVMDRLLASHRLAVSARSGGA